MKSSVPSQGENPAVVELRSLRQEMKQTNDELAGLRSDFKKLNIRDQVAGGVLLAGALLWVGAMVLAMIGHIFVGR